MRLLAIMIVMFACFTSSGWATELPEIGVITVAIDGKLVRKDGMLIVQARNPDFEDKFPVQLIRTEDKQRDLDEYINSLVGHIVTVKGQLSYSRHRVDGPELGISINKKSQIQIPK
jgi:hypothetical protein